eukprot:CAMPEP_0194683704 /NCGR_PEP_ID=MMETSP0295-20121207/13608_1 /TAXON_ID=39354 /ORGANISM="Heterosigma akashiwo, Strain CCMP2393" /LENGTH=101 /DNA_ID=CAMNT_0039570473 /DNA_START=575 /DNA_END=876 /DNA_ORIENTATION=-
MGHPVAQYKSPLRVCIIDLNCFARIKLKDIIRSGCPLADAVLRQAEQAVHRRPRRRARAGDGAVRPKGLQQRGRAAHVALHPGHAVLRLEAEAARVVHDAL